VPMPWWRGTVVAMILMGLGAAGVGHAQQPKNFYAWWDSRVVEDLNLNDAQKRQIRQTVRDYRLKLIDERAAVQKAEAELGDLFNDERFDTKRATVAIDRLAAARAGLTRLLTQMAVELRAVLTIDQWRELQRRRPAAQGMGPLRRRLQQQFK
jgi:Spy/CpxP family protein refolding chaperone